MKKKCGRRSHLYPIPSTLIGTLVDGKPNFAAVANIGILNHSEPQYFSIGVAHEHHTNLGIVQNRSFSINLINPSVALKADYCGSVSGKLIDKSQLFKVFFGELGTAPLAEECPLNIECKLYRTLLFPEHAVHIGEVIGTYAHESVLQDGKPDLTKMQPLLFDGNSLKYWMIGEPFADCWKLSKDFNPAQNVRKS